jgi:glutathione S-transferase
MSARFTLHGMWPSGPSYKIGLFLRLAGIPFNYVHVNLRAGEQRADAYLAKNRFGQVPCLEDHETGLVLCQSSAILEYLTETTGKFLPATPADRARAVEWVFWGWDRLARGIYRTRALKLGFYQAPDDVAAHYRAEGEAGLKDLDRHLAGRDWLAGDAISFADIDLYGIVAYAGQAGFDRAAFPHLDAWAARIEALHGFADAMSLLPQESKAA